MNNNITICTILILAFSVFTATMTVAHNSADATVLKKTGKVAEHVGHRAAPIAISGDNTYIAWWTNNTGNDEVMFRSSNDGGASFTDKINLSNTTNADSQDVEIAADGDTVIVTWWERNQTAEEPIMRISTDGGETFGSLLRLAANGTIGEAPLE